jgi:hypothetical protein
MKQSQTNRSFCQTLGLLILLAVAMKATALAPEHETRRLMLATEEAVEQKQWQQARQYLNRLQALESEKPPAYRYYRGKVLLESGFDSEARSALENYVEQAGAEGKHYTDALKMITRIEQSPASAGNQRSEDEKSERVAVIEPAGGENSARLRQLYLADSDVEALQIHLNTLLDLAGWYQDSRIVEAGAVPDIHYRVKVEDSQIRIQESRRLNPGDGPERRLSTQTMQVYGVNPNVDRDCVRSDESCWIYDPRDRSRLFRLAYDPERAEQIARTLGQLIKKMQTPD